MSAALHYVTHFDHSVASLIIGAGPGVAPSLNGSVIDKLVNSTFWRTVFAIADSGPFIEAGNQLGYVNQVPHQAEVRHYVESYKGLIGPITQWFKGYPQSLASVDPLLEKIDLPGQIFWGDLDQLLFVDNAAVLERRLARSRLRVFEKCGHYAYQGRADELAQMDSEWGDGAYQSLGCGIAATPRSGRVAAAARLRATERCGGSSRRLVVGGGLPRRRWSPPPASGYAGAGEAMRRR